MTELTERKDIQRILKRVEPPVGIAIFFNEYRKKFVSLKTDSLKCQIRFDDEIISKDHIGTYYQGVDVEYVIEDIECHLQERGISL